MCYTANDSLLGYIINSISSILLYNVTNGTQYKVMALFLLFVGQMQIFDYAFWKNQSCNSLNNIITKLAITFNHLQPIILILLQKLYGFQLSAISIITAGLYIIAGLFYTGIAFGKIECTLPENGIMKWDWNNLTGAPLFYTLFIISFLTSSFNFRNGYFKIFAAVATIITIIIAHKTPVLNKSVGRIWCYYAAFMPLVFVGLYYFVRAYHN